MNSNELLEIFYGKEHLEFICGAKKFKTDKDNFVSFWVGKYIVRLRFEDYADKRNTEFPYIVTETKRIAVDIRARKGNLPIFTGEFFPQDPDLIRNTLYKYAGVSVDL